MDGTNADSEKVEQLTDIFTDLTGESSTTERQHEDRWASVSANNSDVDADDIIRSIVREMIDEYRIQTSLDENELVTLVRQYHAGKSDKEIARALGSSSRDKTVARARISLHLFQETDFDAPFELSRLRKLLDRDAPTEEIADTLSASKSTVRAYGRVLDAETEAEHADHEYQHRFEQALADTETDSDGTDRFSETVSASVYASGLEDAVGSS